MLNPYANNAPIMTISHPFRLIDTLATGTFIKPVYDSTDNERTNHLLIHIVLVTEMNKPAIVI